MKSRHDMATAAHLLLRDEHGRILFLRRYNTGYRDGYWSIPAGHVESGESVVEACVREAREEIGVVLELDDLEFVLVQHKHDEDHEERIDFFFAAKLPVGQRPLIGEPHRCDGLSWAVPEAYPSPLVTYVAAAMPTALDPTVCFATFGFADGRPVS